MPTDLAHHVERELNDEASAAIGQALSNESSTKREDDVSSAKSVAVAQQTPQEDEYDREPSALDNLLAHFFSR